MQFNEEQRIWPAISCRQLYGLRGPLVYVYHENAPRRGFIEKPPGLKGSFESLKERSRQFPDKIREIAESKLPDLNAYTVEAAMNIIEGTARNMGIQIED